MSVLVLPDGSDAEQMISARNRLRQYDFIEDSFKVWAGGHGFQVDHRFICELNFYATQYLSPSPGIYRNHRLERCVGSRVNTSRRETFDGSTRQRRQSAAE